MSLNKEIIIIIEGFINKEMRVEARSQANYSEFLLRKKYGVDLDSHIRHVILSDTMLTVFSVSVSRCV